MKGNFHQGLRKIRGEKKPPDFQSPKQYLKSGKSSDCSSYLPFTIFPHGLSLPDTADTRQGIGRCSPQVWIGMLCLETMVMSTWVATKCCFFFKKLNTIIKIHESQQCREICGTNFDLVADLRDFPSWLHSKASTTPRLGIYLPHMET